MAVREGPNAEEVRAATKQIIASDHFVHAESLSNLLKYIVEQTLDGDCRSLKEYTLGVEVFHRGADFNPKEDTIVRVQARALRSRLEAYYQTDGRKDRIRVIVPKGTYVPIFQMAPEQRNAAVGVSRVRIGLAAAITVAAAGLVWTSSVRHNLSRPAGCATLAVLPFDTQSTPEQGFIGPALAQDLATRLSEVPGLTLISFESAMRHKRSGRRLADLHAACAVEGVVTRKGDELEVNVVLKNGTSGRPLWQQIYRRPVKDLPSLEAELTEALASKAVPRPREARASVRRPAAIDPEAALLYLEARHEFNTYEEAGFRRSIELYEQAIQRQPDYALAYAGLALAWFRRSNFFVPPNEGMPKARVAAQHALALAPDLAEARALLSGVSLIYDWRPQAAQAELRRATEIAPNQPLVNEMQALYNISTGRFNEAFANLRIARERDPLSIPLTTFSQFGLLVTRRYRDAVEQGLRAVAREPNAALLRAIVGLSLIYSGRAPEGIEQLAASMRADQSNPVALLAASGFALAGDPVRARQILAEVKGRMPRHYVCAYEIASLHAALGESDEAFAWLEKANRDRNDCMLWLNIEPWFDGLRGDPRIGEFSSQVTFQ